jgi:L-galactonate 5-dehydrogenase
MRAVCLPGPRAVQLVDVPEPVCRPEDVLIDVRYIGLCGSDLNNYRGLSVTIIYPRIPGHEVSGVIVAKGAAVPERVRVGDHVTVNPYTECGLCPACRAGRPNTCQFNETLGMQRDGALTQRIVVPYGKVFASQELSLQELALVEPLSVGYHATNRGRVSETDTVLVLGSGTIGMGAIVAAARKGATVMAVDVDDAKLATAQRFGAAYTIHSGREDVIARVRDLTGGEGPSVVIEAIGLPETFRLAVEAVAYAGRVVYIGYAKHEVTYDSAYFVKKELDIMGSRNALRVFGAVIKMLEKRERPFTDLITRVYPFEETPQAFVDWNAAPGKFSKILIDLAA